MYSVRGMVVWTVVVFSVNGMMMRMSIMILRYMLCFVWLMPMCSNRFCDSTLTLPVGFIYMGICGPWLARMLIPDSCPRGMLMGMSAS